MQANTHLLIDLEHANRHEQSGNTALERNRQHAKQVPQTQTRYPDFAQTVGSGGCEASRTTPNWRRTGPRPQTGAISARPWPPIPAPALGYQAHFRLRWDLRRNCRCRLPPGSLSVAPWAIEYQAPPSVAMGRFQHTRRFGVIG